MDRVAPQGLAGQFALGALLGAINGFGVAVLRVPSMIWTLGVNVVVLGCCVLVTGGFHQFADPVAEQLGFDHVVANRLEVVDEQLTGGLVGPITDSSVKRAVLLEEAARIGAGAISLATGDGANDIPMIEAATYGIAYRAKPKARAAADGWVDRGDLTVVLDLLGIPRDEWVRG